VATSDCFPSKIWRPLQKQNPKRPFVQFAHDFHLSSRYENSLERNTDGEPMQFVEFVSEGW
jgi:hypothetical protein